MIEQRARFTYDDAQVRGLAYGVSGLATLAVAIPAYYLSDDLLVRGVYTGAQMLGVAAVSYGAYLALIDDDFTRANKWLAKQREVGNDTNVMAAFILREDAQRNRTTRIIRVVGHGLTAGLNGLSALTSSDAELRNGLIFLGAVNLIASVGLALWPSDESSDSIEPVP